MGILVAYDITDQTSFNNIDRWMGNIKEHADKDVDIGIVGNKCDLEDKRRISKEQGKQKTDEVRLRSHFPPGTPFCAYYAAWNLRERREG